MNFLKSCYAVDRQDDGWVVVRGVRSAGGCAFAAVADDDPRFRSALERGACCVAALSARQSFTRWVEAPFASVRKARRVFPAVLDVQLPFPLEDCEFALAGVTRTGAGGVRALAVGARTNAVRQALDELAGQGLDPAVLDVAGLAAWSQATEDPALPKPAGLLAVVFLSGTRSCMAVGRGKALLGVHGCGAGDPAQFRRILDLYQAESAAAGAALPDGTVTWLLAGPGAEDAVTLAATRAALPAGTAAEVLVAEEPRFFVAKGMARRALCDGPLRCNLRSGRFGHAGSARRARRRGVAAALACFLTGAILAGAGAGAAMVARHRLANAESEFEAVRDRVAGYPLRGVKGAQALTIAGAAVEARVALLRPFREAFEPSLAGRLAGLVELAHESGLTLDVVRLSSDAAHVSGIGAEWTSGEVLLEWLRGQGYAVRLERGDALADERIPFDLATGVGHE